MLYRSLVRPLLWRLDAETAHHLAFGALRSASAIPGAVQMLGGAPKDSSLLTEALGLRFPGPLGLAAGFDKDAVGFEALGDLGFGFVEIGTLTGQPQPGNPRPRLFRLPEDRALLNRMGFNNGGSEAAMPRLAAPRRTIVGVNIGKTKLVAEEDAIADYVLSTKRLGPHADYFVVNVSSPNTPGLRDLQAVEKLRPLLVAVREALDEVAPPRRGLDERGRFASGRGRVPLLVKIAPDLADTDVDAVAELALDLGLDGILATNTTIRRDGLATPKATVEALGAGGLSGAPLRARSAEVLRRLRARVDDRLVLISIGGIASAAEAWSRIKAGATLVQLYSSFVYEGPTLPARIHEGLAELARAEGFDRVQDAVGVDA
ncbi:MAG: quinone-dependent dihydroorotate dehydrogenase [Sandaracinus sp.]|nr:quinone-dependent dihydroorotate dehydrogenase [Sandaracinus sp.]MCB9618940.1 quinone-dependent dihydroorotate dehydrogenase [Sandaracinus sp.]